LSACTCKGEDHPGPDVSYGRGAPEIDVIEAQVSFTQGRWHGEVSQSLQLAPFDANYEIYNTSSDVQIHDPTNVYRNSYLGGSYQQAASWIAVTPDDGYQLSSKEFISYGE
jgi:hypothetical protein